MNAILNTPNFVPKVQDEQVLPKEETTKVVKEEQTVASPGTSTEESDKVIDEKTLSVINAQPFKPDLT